MSSPAPTPWAPNGVEILEVVYQPPTPEPAPVVRDSPVWDLEKDDELPAKPPAPTAQLAPKMVSPNKTQPTLFKHLVPALSSSGAAAKVNSEGNAVASGSKPSTSTKVVQNLVKSGDLASRKPKLDGSSGEAQLEYIFPKQQAGGKPATKGTKRGANHGKANEPPAKKSKGKEREEVLDISSDDAPARREEEFVNRFIEKKEASNAATVVAMDSKRELHLVREQLAAAQTTIEELREKIRDHEVEKRVQERLQAMGAAAPAAMTELQFHDHLAQYLQDNNLTIVDNWDNPPFPDPTHPFNT
ncbi:hypothetical protein RSOL_018130, partial [Rhizoctonia solani AG-3 Rhs1AP]